MLCVAQAGLCMNWILFFYHQFCVWVGQCCPRSTSRFFFFSCHNWPVCEVCIFLCVRAKPPKAYRAAREELPLVAIAPLFWNHSVDIPRNTAVTAASRFCAMNIWLKINIKNETNVINKLLVFANCFALILLDAPLLVRPLTTVGLPGLNLVIRDWRLRAL